MRIVLGSTRAPECVIMRFVHLCGGRSCEATGRNDLLWRSVGKGGLSVFEWYVWEWVGLISTDEP